MGLCNMTMQQLIRKSDYEWYKGLFSSQEKKKITKIEQNLIIDKSIACAQEIYNKFWANITEFGLEETIKNYGVEISYNDLNESDTVIAMYDKKANLLIVFNHAINELIKQVKVLGLQEMISKRLLINLVLSHELYHIIEMNEPNIFTYSKFYEYSLLGYKKKKRLTVASEIGAFHFSKVINGIDFSPCVIGELYKEI